MIGCGLQILITVILVTIVHRFVMNQIVGLVPIVFGLFSSLNGWAASKFYVLFNGTSWFKFTFLASVTYPLIMITCIFVISKSNSNFFGFNSNNPLHR